ncbi:MAG: type I restriction enzyme S subunit [Nonlabens sp.]|jgi:type I restriction enzyme S subunit
MREDWIECELETVASKITKGSTPTSYGYKFQTSGINFIKIENVKKGIINTSGMVNFISKEAHDSQERSKLSKDDILFSIAGTIGETCLVTEDVLPANTSQAFAIISGFNKCLIPGFLRLQFESFVVVKVKSKARGGAMNNVSLGDLKALITIFPPLPEQRAIVAKIEELFSSLDSGIADLKKAQEKLKIYRQAVLKKAFEGEFTKEWRAKQANLSTADQLLEQIKEERQNHYKQQIEDWKKAVKDWEANGMEGKKPSRISKPNIISDVKDSDVEKYDGIPLEWYWARFGNVTYKIGDIDHKMPKVQEGGLPYLSTGNIKKDGSIDLEGAKTISRVDFDRLALKIKPERGDIIFPRYGTIGRNVLIDFDKEFLVSYSCAIIKNITKLMDAKFALYYSLSPIIKNEIKRYTVETTQANIGIASIELFVYPLCSKEEQHQIVQEIESRLSVCDKVEESIVESLEKSKALRQSILKKAFEGRLLNEQELAACKSAPDYEPAAVLLKRIKEEKATGVKKGQLARKA